MDRPKFVKNYVKLRKLNYNNKTYALDKDTNELLIKRPKILPSFPSCLFRNEDG